MDYENGDYKHGCEFIPPRCSKCNWLETGGFSWCEEYHKATARADKLRRAKELGLYVLSRSDHPDKSLGRKA